MLLKSIKLHNIRSYENQELEFPKGSVLLAGDIGSGKSTIMLAIEFALFGAKKGDLPAYALLSHGKREGAVKLRMFVEKDEVTIKRTLKRVNEDIRQEAGYIILNGSKREGTAEEMRAWMLDILGYPKNLVKKGRDMIYRYTVYTPQEEMKLILYQDNETRLETLRKIFNIDKYKRIKDNSRIIAASLREKKKQLEGYLSDFEYKKKEILQRKAEALKMDGMISDIIPKSEELKTLIEQKKKSIGRIEEDISLLNSLRKELGVTETSLRHKIEQNNSLNDEIKKLESQIEGINKELEKGNLGEIKSLIKKIEDKENEIIRAEQAYRNKIKGTEELRAKINQSKEIIKKIKNLEVCPLCEQKVDEGHKHNTIAREQSKNEEIAHELKKCIEEELRFEETKLRLRGELNMLVKEQNHLNIRNIMVNNLNEKNDAKNEKTGIKEKIRKEIGSLNARKIELNSNVQQYSDLEGKYNAVKKEIDILLPQERFLELERRKYETEKESLLRQIGNLEKEIDEKEKAREKLLKLTELNNWIEEFFVNLVATIEKHVMVNIHSQFNDLFKKWFEMLIEDEAISARIDEDFTPLIEQNGYETYLENLSGGEKTSVALAYRLALNKVINEMVSTIKTKDIIMLDEPTDGFSSEQLDKVREVLQELNMKQVIIVSHEGKIESFVENVIRVEKRDSVSMIM